MMMKLLTAIVMTGLSLGVFAAVKAPKAADGFEDEDGNWVSDKVESNRTVRASDWGIVPLGEAGTLAVDTAFKAKPEFRTKPVRKNGPVLIGGTRIVTVVAPTEKERELAAEIAWHLKEMSGRDVPVADSAPSAGPAVLLSFSEDKGEEVSSIRTDGERVTLAGAGAGLSHAVTYFLEELGIRYLWPGRLGKVIPKRSKVVFPLTNWTFTPTMRVRCMRSGPIKPWKGNSNYGASRSLTSLNRLGLDAEAFRLALNGALVDHEGNRSFMHWHGVNDNQDSMGADGNSGAPYKWGHSFKWVPGADLMKTHPDYLALQPDGTRTIKNGRNDRACFCLSNPDFVKRTIEETVLDFDRRSNKVAIAIGLPDGGGGCPCMCERCRRMDPKNAPPRDYAFHGSTMEPYVSLTDRVLAFFNQVVDGALKERPGKRGLTFFPYSCYVAPPVSVRPDPRLIPLSVAGDYTNAANWDKARANVAAWMNFGLETYWRPNCMGGWKVNGPRSFARRMFMDYETMKANGLKGTEFDVVGNSWANKGFWTYVIARVALNPDRLDFDTIADDYCRAGFGKAASEMRDYFEALERMCSAAAKKMLEPAPKVSDFRGTRPSACYLKALDFDELSARLSRAESAAADDADAVARIRFLKVGLEYGRLNKAVCLAKESLGDDLKSRKAFRNAQRRYAAFVRETAIKEPLAQDPMGICFYNPFMYDYKYVAPKAKKEAK